MNRISSRQLFFFLACVAPVGKLVILPAQLAQSAKNDLLLPALFHFLIQAAVIFCILLLAKREKGLYELLAATFGGIAAKIIVTLFSAFLLYAALLPLLEQKLFVQGVFYDTLPSLVAFAPFFLFAAYLCAKPLFSLGRVCDLIGPVAIAGMAGILLLSVADADFGALLPLGASGGSGILRGTMSACSRFFDSALVLCMLGKIKYEKGLCWKGTLCYLAGAAGSLFFLAVFYGIFQETAAGQLFAFSKTSKYFAGITVLGRIDYLFIFAMALVMAFYTVLPVHGAVDVLTQAYGRGKFLPAILSVLFNLFLFLLTYMLDYRFGEVNNVISNTLFWIFPVFGVLLPPLCLLLGRDRNHA